MLDVVALGELLIDFASVGTDAAGYPTLQAQPGGAPANFLAALTKFGAKTALIGKIGQDAFGRLLTGTLAGCGIETRGLVTTAEAFTTLAFVTLDEKGERTFSFARKPGADTCLRWEEVDRQLMDAARVFHFGTLSLTHEPARQATREAVAYARKQGKLISCDPNLRLPLWPDAETAREAMGWAVEQADIVKISQEETQFLLGLDAPEAAAFLVNELGVQLALVTCGSEGCWFCNPKARGHVPALDGITVRDTTGAGDIFGGSALWQLLQQSCQPGALEEAALRQTVRFATVSAGLSTTRPGGLNSVPDYGEVLARLETFQG